MNLSGKTAKKHFTLHHDRQTKCYFGRLGQWICFLWDGATFPHLKSIRFNAILNCVWNMHLTSCGLRNEKIMNKRVFWIRQRFRSAQDQAATLTCSLSHLNADGDLAMLLWAETSDSLWQHPSVWPDELTQQQDVLQRYEAKKTRKQTRHNKPLTRILCRMSAITFLVTQ